MKIEPTQGPVPSPVEGLDALIAQVEGKPLAMARLARVVRVEGHKQLAHELSLRALDLAPHDEQVRALTADVLSIDVPRWHFRLVHDEARNNAYEAALRRAVFPGCKVLEIGTGTGLLAMMAARAGAAEVVTCESSPAVAAAAKDIVAHNGYADRIRVIGKHSTSLDAEKDLHGRADILISEIIGCDRIGEGALPALEHAAKHLMKPGATWIPARAHIRVALSDDAESERFRMGMVAGFDLSPFNRLAAPDRGIKIGSSRLALRSTAVDVFSFDFRAGGPYLKQRRPLELISHGGRINGIAQWIMLELDDVTQFENRPSPGADSSWFVNFFPFERAHETHAGERIAITARHDRSSLRVWMTSAGH